MEMMYLVLWISSQSGGTVVMPQAYPKAQCERVAKLIPWEDAKHAFCVPAPSKKCQASATIDGGRTYIAVPVDCGVEVGSYDK